MEKRINSKIDSHQVEFKQNIMSWLKDNNCVITSTNINKDMTSDFLKFVYDYDNISLTESDFKKRKRTKNNVNQYERCCANRANGEQCTRRRKKDSLFCGTHEKGTPHGVVDSKSDTKPKNKKVEIWVQEINGINYYIDNMSNVYLSEDIISNKVNPRIVGNWVKDGEEYKIPNLEDYM